LRVLPKNNLKMKSENQQHGTDHHGNLAQVITEKKISISQKSGLKFVQIAKPNNVVKKPIADVNIHLFITNPGKSQLKILKIFFNKIKLDFLKFI